MGNFYPVIPESAETLEAKRISKMYMEDPKGYKKWLKSNPLIVKLSGTPLSKKDKLKLELGKRFSAESHEVFLNDRKENLDKSCSKYALFNKEGHYYIILPCGKWTCPICGINNARDLVKRMESSEANKWKNISHIIITVADFKVNESIDELWNNLLVDLKRGGTFSYYTVYGKLTTKTLPERPGLKYIKVKEFQLERFLKDGVWYRHIHAIFNQYITKYEIIPIWNQISHTLFNYIEDRHPHNINAGKYLFKYFTKPEYQDLFLKGERRYSCSRGLIPPRPVNKTPSNAWEFMSLEHAKNLAEAFKKDPNLEIAWKYEKEYNIDSIRAHLERLRISHSIEDLNERL